MILEKYVKPLLFLIIGAMLTFICKSEVMVILGAIWASIEHYKAESCWYDL